MADTLIREKIAYNSNPFSPVPTYWNGTSYEKVQGVNGSAKIVAYDLAGETFTDANPASVATISSAGGTIVLSSTSPGIVEIISSASGTALMSNSNPANMQIISSAGGTVVLNNSSPGFIEIVSSAGGTAYFSNTNQGYLTHKYSENEANVWSASATISSGATSRVINAIYNEKVNYFGTITNTATITLSMQVSQNNFSWYTAESQTITAGTTTFFYTFTTSARYLRLSSNGVSAIITASIMGKYKWYTNIVSNGNFANGTTLWSGDSSAISVSDNTLTDTGDGTSTYGRVSQLTSSKPINGSKIFVSARMRVTNAACLFIYIWLRDGTGTVFSLITQPFPIQNQWYNIYGIIDITASLTSTLRIYATQTYVDAATANGKVMEIQEVLAVDLTWYFGAGNEPDADTCNKIFPFIE